MATRSKSGDRGIQKGGLPANILAELDRKLPFPTGMVGERGLPTDFSHRPVSECVEILERVETGSWILEQSERELLLLRFEHQGADLVAEQLAQKPILAEKIHTVLFLTRGPLSTDEAGARVLTGFSRAREPAGHAAGTGAAQIFGSHRNAHRIEEILDMAVEIVNRDFQTPPERVQALAWFVRSIFRLPNGGLRLKGIMEDNPKVWLFGSGKREN